MKEIERKFLVSSGDYKLQAESESNIRQWYLNRDKDRTVRVRLRDEEAYLTIKGKTTGISRDEFEYRIPVEDARKMLPMADGLVIEKTRYIVNHKGKIWEIDEFHGAHEGLVLAEIELSDDEETFEIPSFISEEVSGNPQYYNSYLSSQPLTLSQGQA